MTIRGFDVSKWQIPEQFDWAAMEADEEFRFIVARASYGKGLADPHLVQFATKADEHNLTFGVYHFARQIHSAEEQLALFDKQIRSIGGLKAGDFYPVLDIEENSKYDGKPKAQLFSTICRTMAEALKAEYGNVILYYSAFFPEWFGSHRAWMVQGGYLHWLADYNRPDGQPRTPYTPTWQLHQPKPRTTPYYKKGREVVDHNVVNPLTNFSKLLLPGDPAPMAPTVSDDAKKGDEDTTARPGGALPEEVFDGFEMMREGAAMMAAGLEVVLGAQEPRPKNRTGG
jgi:hypothetical protein